MRPKTRDEILEIAKRHRPKGWRVRESRHRWSYTSASADWEKRTLFVPSLIDEESLLLYMHEVGHVKLNHFNLKLPAHREEFEAECYAMHILRCEGIRITRQFLNDARTRVCGHIRKDIKRGVKIQPHVARWAKFSGE